MAYYYYFSPEEHKAAKVKKQVQVNGTWEYYTEVHNKPPVLSPSIRLVVKSEKALPTK